MEATGQQDHEDDLVSEGPAVCAQCGNSDIEPGFWLGVTIAMHAFPSTGDGEAIWDTLEGRQTSLATRLIGVPAIGVICLAALGRFVWLDLLYGLAVAMLLPEMVIWLSV